MRLTKDQLDKYEKDGYLVIDNFFDDSVCSTLKDEVDNILEDRLVANLNSAFPEFPILPAINIFSAKRDIDEFVESGNKMSVFSDMSISESEEWKEKMRKNLREQLMLLKPNLNKIAYALHAMNPKFKDATFSSDVQDIFKSLNYSRPIVCQSMYILKRVFTNKNASGHQDATYINLKSPKSLATLWIAMEDCDAQNGCLKLVPGSHKTGLQRKFIKNPKNEHKSEVGDEESRFIYTDPPISDYEDEDFVSVPIKKGSALLLNGLTVHKSTETEKPMSREAYVFHVYDSDKNEFEDTNWMKYSESTFIPMYQ